MAEILLIDAIYINDGGGKILLDYLLHELEKTDKKCIYLLDKRMEKKVDFLSNSKNEVYFLEASLYKRHLFYLKHKEKITKVFCFCGIPPSTKLKAIVYTYMHSDLYIKVPKDSSFKFKFLYFLKRLVLKFFANNSNYWMLQTDTIANNFGNKFNIDKGKVFRVPFFPPIERNTEIIREKNTFVYISNALPHKNHTRLINAFCEFYDKEKKGKLLITVDFFYQNLVELIEEKQKKGYPIVNLGFIERRKLRDIYSATEFLVYPSLAESFGLSIIEAIECGCKVIGADLEYLYAVCEPSLIFNPVDENSIAKILSLSIKSNLNPSRNKSHNQIDVLLSLL